MKVTFASDGSTKRKLIVESQGTSVSVELEDADGRGIVVVLAPDTAKAVAAAIVEAAKSASARQR